MAKTKTLLQQAKEINIARNKKNNLTKEDIELCVAWANDEISLGQICAVKKINKTGNSPYIFLARGLREYIRRNKG